MITGIVVALKEELGTLTTKKLAKGEIANLNDEVLVIYSGAGQENARQAAETLISKGVVRMISWGCAAALQASLKPGDLVLAESCSDINDMGFECSNKDWVKHAESIIAHPIVVHVGRMAGSRDVISSTEGKAAIGAKTGAIALDMESCAIAEVARLNQMPFLTVRAIADSMTLDLPKAVAYAVNQDGEVSLIKLLFYVAKHPVELIGLVRLGWAFAAAKATLKCVAKDLDKLTRFGALSSLG